MSIVDVAKLAGVSNSTVSRVINNHPRVSRETVQAVKAAMDQLNYTPSDRRPGPKPGMRTAAQTPVPTVAFIVFGTASDRATPAFEELMRGVSDGAADQNVRLVYHHVADANVLPDSVLAMPPDGLLLHGAFPCGPAREALRQFPTVWLMGNRRRPDWGDQVMPDTYEIGDKAARYLLGRGHTRLAFLNLDESHWPFRVTRQSFAAAAKDAGAGCVAVESARDSEAAYWPTFTPAAADALVTRFLAVEPRPTGLFVADDLQVATVQPALQRAGVVLGPGQTEVISCNNETPYLGGLSPRPAEVDIRVEAVGVRGVERLLWRLNHRDVAERIVTAVEPVIIGHDGRIVGHSDAAA